MNKNHLEKQNHCRMEWKLKSMIRLIKNFKWGEWGTSCRQRNKKSKLPIFSLWRKAFLDYTLPLTSSNSDFYSKIDIST